MNRIFVIQRFTEREDCPGQFRSYLLDIVGFFTSEYRARKYLGWYLMMKGFEYTVNEEGDYVVSDSVHYSIVRLDKNFTENE